MLPDIDDDDAQFQSTMPRGNPADLPQDAPLVSIDDIIQAPLSDADADVELLAQMLNNKEAEAILLAAHPPLPSPRTGNYHQTAARKRKRSSGDDDARRARRKTKRARLLRAAHREVAARILTRRFRALEPSRGRTLLRAALGCGRGRGGGVGARDSVAKVTQYGRWRRSVWVPTQFYLQHAAERGVAWRNG